MAGWGILWVLTFAFSLSAHPQTYESEKEREKDDLIQARHSLSCDQINVTFVKILTQTDIRIYSYQQIYTQMYVRINICLTKCMRQGSLFFVIKGETSLEKTQILADFMKN